MNGLETSQPTAVFTEWRSARWSHGHRSTVRARAVVNGRGDVAQEQGADRLRRTLQVHQVDPCPGVGAHVTGHVRTDVSRAHPAAGPVRDHYAIVAVLRGDAPGVVRAGDQS